MSDSGNKTLSRINPPRGACLYGVTPYSDAGTVVVLGRALSLANPVLSGGPCNC